jgi:hypothetical protein
MPQFASLAPPVITEFVMIQVCSAVRAMDPRPREAALEAAGREKTKGKEE